MQETVTVEIPWSGGPGHTEMRSVEVEVSVDAVKVANYLALKAIRNKGYRSKAMYGGVCATVAELPKLETARYVPFGKGASNVD